MNVVSSTHRPTLPQENNNNNNNNNWLQLCFHSVAVVLTLIKIINIHKRNNTKNTVQTILNTVNTSTHITKTPTHTNTPYSAYVKERVELYLYSTSGPSWPVTGWTLPLLVSLPVFLLVFVRHVRQSAQTDLSWARSVTWLVQLIIRL